MADINQHFRSDDVSSPDKRGRQQSQSVIKCKEQNVNDHYRNEDLVSRYKDLYRMQNKN